ncbi:tubulointerstitial nephritis antigen [Pyxicephalus adspersus]|uniref:tubulointerstitial nephritis antigen n=1 Tax=Pyxicephalus adspersus TaxID=30357 RepID=UPI003B5AA8A0
MGFLCQIPWCLLFTNILFLNSFVSGRGPLVNLYSVEDISLFRSIRAKRSVETDSYCQKNGCCDSRNDDCNAYFIGKNATCYCETFCDQKELGHIDCCPDYWSTCAGQNLEQATTKVPLTVTFDNGNGCDKAGTYYEDRSVTKDNCNYCYCHNSQWICTNHTCLVEPDLINLINTRNLGWRAENYSQFWGMTLNEGFEYRLGTIPPSSSLLSMNEMAVRVSPDEEFPLHFISSYKWPQYIHRPLDQKNCAASWAFSTASVAADRIAIHSEGRFTSNLSPHHLISCNVHNQNGCRGGHIDSAWWFLRKRGLVSHECYPYTADDSNNIHATCSLSSVTGNYGKSYATTPCPNSLVDSNYLYQCSPPYRIASNERAIMKEIFENGPVQAVMTVYEDFFLYKSGIYKYSGLEGNTPYRQLKGTHSVKIIGWGTLGHSEKDKFWIVANSWGNSWGENGYFKIHRGKNECGIESLIIAAWCHVNTK